MVKDNSYFPNAPESMGKTYYVAQNTPNASDDNAGTEESPFKTISKAASVVDMSDEVIIEEGTYREEVPIIRHGHQYYPESLVTFKAVVGKKVYLKGSDIFEPDWETLGAGVFKAKLPQGLFQQGVYNPYELSGVINEPKKVRPVEGTKLEETLGQIYVDGEPLEQLDSLRVVENTPGSFVVSGEGKEIIVHFADGKVPKGKLMELTVRERCFRPKFSGSVFIQTKGMVIEHAANPGPFCFCRPFSIRRNPGTGISIRKTYCLRRSIRTCDNIGLPRYKSKDKPTIIVSAVDDTRQGPMDNAKIYTLKSEDAGKTWKVLPTGQPRYSQQSVPWYYFDEENGMLVRHYVKYPQLDLNGLFGETKYEVLLEVSSDEGKTWNSPQRIDSGGYYFRIIKLQDGSLLWPGTVSQYKDFYHARLNILLGKWRDDLSGIDWEQAGTLKIDPKKSTCGLDEPQACQLPDGRLFIIIRQGNVHPTQDHPGAPSVKLFTISEDGGRTWSKARPLTHEDGRYIYSSRSYPDVFRSSKNGRTYVILNISEYSTDNCEPRTTLHIAELDTESLSVKRDTVAIIETKHEEHHPLVRFSNWVAMEDRYTKNLLLFMQLRMSEYCPVRYGYDFNIYRYEIELPD